MVNIGQLFRFQSLPIMSVEAPIPILDAMYVLNIVVIIQTVVDLADDDIKTWTYSPTGDDACPDLVWTEEDMLSGTSSQIFLGFCEGVFWAKYCSSF